MGSDLHVLTVVDNPDNREKKSKSAQPHKKMVWILRKIIWVLVSINRQKTIVTILFLFSLNSSSEGKNMPINEK